ncbi:MAG: hypothetical protein ACI31F_05990 [Muribaculaceae bacterium]
MPVDYHEKTMLWWQILIFHRKVTKKLELQGMLMQKVNFAGLFGGVIGVLGDLGALGVSRLTPRRQ